MQTSVRNLVFGSALSLLVVTSANVSAQNIPGEIDPVSTFRAARERIYVHLDKEIYTAGEIVWFKVYATHPSTNMPVHVSKVSYVEILDATGKPVVQAKVEMDEDGGDGSFYLPLNILTGGYTLRAYTNVTRRSGTAHSFDKDIYIINTVKNAPAASPIAEGSAMLDLFPEGGQTVDGQQSVVAFQLKDAGGKGINGAGIVTGDKGDTVATFSTVKNGMGRFRITPAAGRKYTASVLVNGQTISQVLPSALPAGLSMQVVRGDLGTMAVHVSGKPLSDDDAGENITVVVHNGSRTLAAHKAFLVYGKTQKFAIDRSKLVAGINHITLFDARMRPIAERLLFITPPADLPLRISTSQPAFALRAPVTLNVNFKTDASDTLLLSASVFRFDSLKNLSTSNIITSSWLTGLRFGEVEDPQYYLADTPEASEAADLLMLTHGWRTFHTPGTELPVELTGHVVTARVTDDAERPAANMTCYLTVPSTPAGLYVARSDAKGYVRFTIQRYYGSGDIIIQPVPEDGKNYKVYIQTPFSTDAAPRKGSGFQLNKEHERVLLQKNLAMQVQNIYTGDSIRLFSMPAQSDTLAFFGKPEFNYWLENYKQFQTMEEVLREYVAPINVVMKNGSQKLRIYDELNKKMFDDYMLVLLDGVPLKNPDKIFSYDPLKIRRIQVVPRSYLYGAAYFTGIASFESYNGKFDGFELDPSIVAIDYEGLQLKRRFYSPAYNDPRQSASRIPDMRTTLQWLPDLKLVANQPQAITFYTSDIPGSYVVIAEGVSRKGKLVSVTGSFEVK